MKQSKADFLRSWGLPYPAFPFHNLRYKQPPEKGVYWFYFSLYVRKRDVEAYGVCISCGTSITVETSQAGHFMPARDCGRDLLFSPLNVNAECAYCNAFDETHLLGYADGLNERYGDATAGFLRGERDKYLQNKSAFKDWKSGEYEQKIEFLAEQMGISIPRIELSTQRCGKDALSTR